MRRIFPFILLCLLGLLSGRDGHAQSAGRNYVRTRTYLQSGTGAAGMDKIQYFDGLGRETQTVLKGFSPSRQDVASGVSYDAAGRKWREYVPVLTGYSDGRHYAGLATQTKRDGNPYTEYAYEPSPLERVISATGPGSAWHLAGKAKRSFRSINTSSGVLGARRFEVSADGSLSSPGNWAEGDLTVDISVDEDGDSTLTFTDRRGLRLLERRRDGGVSHDTYYVYDGHKLLCWVLPPAAEGKTDAETLSKYAFHYVYDHRDRCVEKTLPGCAPIYMVYDRADRLVLRQDGEQRRRDRWTVTKYDAAGRPLYSYGHTDPTPFSTLRERLRNVSATEVPTGGDTGFLGTGYTCNTVGWGTDVRLLTASYYDGYGFLETLSAPERSSLSYEPREYYEEPNPYPCGLLTGTRTCLTDGSGGYLATAIYYDRKSRMVYRASTVTGGGCEKEWLSHTFTGNPERRFLLHADGTTLETGYVYDHADRLQNTVHVLDGMAPFVSRMDTYDDYGRLKSSSFHNRMYTAAYTHDLRDRLTSIDGSGFSQTLHYTDGPGTPRYDGNISSMTWKAGDEGVTRGYRFSYDRLDRLTEAAYGEGSGISANPDRFTEKVTAYDLNGNILGLQRYGRTGADSYGLVDELALTLDGNQLSRVYDAAGTHAYGGGFEFRDGADRADEYAYDENGNLVKDLNKDILRISYNSLNLPDTVRFGDGSTISYVYAYDGTKVRAVHSIKGVTTVTDYRGHTV